MTQNRKCSHPGCKAWAMHGKDYCSAHRPGGIPGVGARRGNLNAFKHGLYADKLAEKIQQHLDRPDGQIIDTELALLHTVNKCSAICLRELMASGRKRKYDLIIRLSQALCQNSEQTLRLLEARQASPPDFDSVLAKLNEVAGWENVDGES
jgi:hypothetical protein